MSSPPGMDYNISCSSANVLGYYSMGFWTAAVIIMAIFGFVEVSKYWIRSRDERRTHSLASEDQHKIEDLEDRVRALETILTDSREQLKRQIDSI
ncbi:MAG: hypothetical protein AAGH65_11625 [Pseudomonadota bacterium]